MIENLRPLTQEQRQSARRAAQKAVIQTVGVKPNREHFSQTTITKYPAAVTRLIAGLCLLLLLAAFTPSAIRLYVIGSHTFGQSVSSETAQIAVGLATVLSAEIGQIVFSLALATLGATPPARRLLYASMSLTTAVSLVGNIQIALPGHEHSPFAWLEAVVPPLIVLSTAYVLKGQLLDTIEQRYTHERAYQTALAEWQAATADPERHPQWSQCYANALRDALRHTNARRQESLATLTTADWRSLVYRELQSERWYEETVEGVSSVASSWEIETVPLAQRAKANGNGLHALEGAV